MAATVTSTGEDASLSVLDPSANDTGRLTNGAYALASPLEVRANSAAFAPLRADNGPLALMTLAQPDHAPQRGRSGSSSRSARPRACGRAPTARR